MKTWKILLVVVTAAAVQGQIPSLGTCPDYQPMTQFDMDKFLGKWYETEKYFSVSEVGSRCVTMEYTKGPSGRIYVSNELINRLTGVKRVYDGIMNFAGKDGEGKMSIKYNSFPSYDTHYTVLDTDYKSFAVVWYCSGIGPVHTQNAWVWTRGRNPSTKSMQRAYGVLDKYKIRRTFFLKTDQTNCNLEETQEELATTQRTYIAPDKTKNADADDIKIDESVKSSEVIGASDQLADISENTKVSDEIPKETVHEIPKIVEVEKNEQPTPQVQTSSQS